MGDRVRVLGLWVVVAAAPACASVGVSDADPSDTSSDTGDGASDTDGEAPVQLAACGQTLSCAAWFDHGLDIDPLESLECAARLALAGTPGILSYTTNYGEATYDDHIVVLLGDGTARTQRRLLGGDMMTVLESDLQQTCALDLPVDLAEACASEGGDCTWTGKLQSCVEAEAWTCADLAAALTQ